MRIAATLFCIALAVVAGVALARTTASAQGDSLIVLELYQSQGCSSCPPANANVAAITGRPDVVVLSFAVTYWDNLGWRDTFAKPQFTARQYAYARGLGHSNVYTPQVVLNGRIDLSGVNASDLSAAMSRVQRISSRLISLENGRLGIGPAEAQAPADVWLVHFDRRTLPVPISAGENEGRTLPHKNIVRDLVHLGTWAGSPVSFPVAPPSDPNFGTAILVQKQNGGPIVAAAKF
ncbi:MAG: DUF1223 domain-containing protein [Alphaproteobacteria bacterium]|nr:DUF1223 domain-containing protein [Alphaproteobacteria bacterium]